MVAAYSTNEISDRRKLQVQSHFSQSASRYLDRSRSAPWSFVRHRELAAVRSVIHPSAEAQVLEVGSGAGYYHSCLSSEFQNWVNVEPNYEMYNEAVEYGIDTFHGDLDAFIAQNPRSKFDRALVAGVLEFLENKEEGRLLCEKLLSVMNPGGRIVILSPTAGPLGAAYLWRKRRSGCPTMTTKCISEIKKSLGLPHKTVKHFFSQTQVWHF